MEILGETEFLTKWVELAKLIRDWHEENDGSPYPTEGNKFLLTVQSLRVFENLFKIWSENVPVKRCTGNGCVAWPSKSSVEHQRLHQM